jgi:hypothetical protein
MWGTEGSQFGQKEMLAELECSCSGLYLILQGLSQMNCTKTRSLALTPASSHGLSILSLGQGVWPKARQLLLARAILWGVGATSWPSSACIQHSLSLGERSCRSPSWKWRDWDGGWGRRCPGGRSWHAFTPSACTVMDRTRDTAMGTKSAFCLHLKIQYDLFQGISDCF